MVRRGGGGGYGKERGWRRLWLGEGLGLAVSC